jgi:hypothetical protein
MAGRSSLVEWQVIRRSRAGVRTGKPFGVRIYLCERQKNAFRAD